jgi:protein phosphatase
LSPDEAKNWPRRNVITRAIGVRQQPELEIKDGALAPGDVFLICTDGLTGLIADTEIHGALENGGCQAACEALVDMTLARGAYDNVTVVAVRYNPKIENGEIESEPPIIGKESVRTADAQNTIPLATEGRRLRRHD